MAEWIRRPMAIVIVQSILLSLAGSFPISSIGCTKPTAQPLSYCHRYSASTCCRPQHDQQILQNVAGLYAFAGNDSFTPACIDWTSRLACSVCDARVSGPDPVFTQLCPSTCRSWFQACRTDPFATNTRTGLLAPCSPVSLVCSTAQQIFDNDHVGFCSRFGFQVAKSDSDRCYRNDLPKPSRENQQQQRQQGHAGYQPPPPPPRSWLGAGFMVALTLLMLKRIWSRPSQDEMVQANEEMLARRALLVQVWAERNQIDLGGGSTAGSESHDLDPVRDLHEPSSVREMEPESESGQETGDVQFPETTTVTKPTIPLNT